VFLYFTGSGFIYIFGNPTHQFMEDQQVCLNCGHTFSGKFCNQCGEKVYTEHDRSVPHLFEEAFHFFTHFEGKFFNTLKAVLLKPGKLSLDYCDGLRKKYFKPLSFFLLLVIIYLLFPVFEGLNQRLEHHQDHEIYGTYATARVEKIKKERNIDDEAVAELFQRKSEKASKFLLFVIIPCMAVFSWAAGFRKRKYYFDHFVFSIEAASVLVLVIFLLLPLLLIILALFHVPVRWIEDLHVSIVSTIILSVYLALMSKRFFGFKWWYNIIFCTVYFVGMLVVIQYVYRTLLFFISIHLI
jgi:hypothetical protein